VIFELLPDLPKFPGLPESEYKSTKANNKEAEMESQAEERIIVNVMLQTGQRNESGQQHAYRHV
jgi:hypothetical protein